MEAVITNLLDEPAVRSIVINYRDITERKQKEEEIQSRTEELTALYQLSRALADAKDLENVMALVNRHAVESVHTTYACIALVEDKELVPRAVYPIRYMEHDLILGHRQAITALPLCQQIMDKNEPVILQAANSEISNVERDILMLDFVQSVCLVPMWAGEPSQHLNLALGLMILGEARQEKREPFTPEKIRLARSIGDQAAAAIRRLVLREQAGRRLQQLASLSEIDRTIASNFDLRISLNILLKHVIEQLNVDAADVLVLNNHTKALEYASGSGFRSKRIEGSSQPMDEGQAGRALLERQIVKIPNVAASGADFAHPELLKAENIAAYFSVPLITKGQVVGVLEICHRTPLDPNEEWLDFLRTLAGQAAIAIDNVHMFENLQRSTDELELAYDATIEGWSHALDLRDKETEGHTQRVTEGTMNLARSFGLSEAELVQIRWGALLHDIGKMGVPDSILLKPGTLTEDEWVVMRKHPGLAYEMLLPIRYLHGALDIPYCHHEWWDGTGYPRRLKGEEIPLAARIFAVVDVWDALISDRPYRKAWSKEKAREHIEGEAGMHFDAQVVIKFLLGQG
jgi:HD-GYP domain-containing protein (c-di-GMP phosphodiesterase class II)